MNNLRTGVIALILTSIAWAVFSQESANENVDAYISFMNQKAEYVSVTLMIHKDGEWNEVQSTKENRKEMKLSLKSFNEYLVIIEDSDKTKILHLNLNIRTRYYYNVIVDFDKDQDLHIGPDRKDSTKYSMKLITF